MRNRFSLLALLAIGITTQAWSDTALLPQHNDQDHSGEDSGVVRFHGSVFASPCVLAMQSRIQDVEMSDISARRFHQAGDRSQPVLVKVYLKDCLKGASMARGSVASKTAGENWRARTTGEQAVQMTFIGESDIANRQLLRTSGSVHGAGIRLMDANGKSLDLNQTQRPYLVKTGDSELTFLAALESTETHVSAGEFHGLIRLKMEYL
jgi:P pilus assembly protein, pilin FimA